MVAEKSNNKEFAKRYRTDADFIVRTINTEDTENKNFRTDVRVVSRRDYIPLEIAQLSSNMWKERDERTLESPRREIKRRIAKWIYTRSVDASATESFDKLTRWPVLCKRSLTHVRRHRLRNDDFISFLQSFSIDGNKRGASGPLSSFRRAVRAALSPRGLNFIKRRSDETFRGICR